MYAGETWSGVWQLVRMITDCITILKVKVVKYHKPKMR